MARTHTGILKKTLQHTSRFQEIVSVLIRYGFTDYLTILRLDKRFRFVRRLMLRGHEQEVAHLSRAELIRKALEELGPTFIKLGQLLSNRPDIIPADLLHEFTSLQDDVAPVALARIERVIEEEFHTPVAELFAWFDTVPLASASIAQVHRAELTSGNPIAVKVQRPDIWNTMSIDLDILTALAHLTERYIPESRFFQPVQLVHEFRDRLKEEIDFSRESRYMQQFSRRLQVDSSIRIPRVFPSYCTTRVLSMEYLDGTRFGTFLVQNRNRDLRKQIAHTLADEMMEQIFLHGSFHADPHPGNIIIFPDGRIGLLDFGLVGILRPIDKRYLSMMLQAIVQQDSAQMSEALLRITAAPDHLLREHIEDDVYDILHTYVDVSVKELDTEALLMKLIGLAVSRGLTVPTSLLLFSKTLLLLDGLVRELVPDINILELFEPFVRHHFTGKVFLDEIRKNAASTSRDFARLLQTWPRDTRELVEQVKHGKLKIHFHVEGIDPLRATLDTISYRLVLGLLLAAVIISSSLVVHAGIPPLWHGVPIFGIIGFLGAGTVSLIYLGALMIRYFTRLYRK